LEDPKEQSLQADEGIAVFSRRTPQSDRQAAAVVDIGTGSGAIAISMALERPDLRISATDVSADALDVARDNAERHGVLNRMTFLQGNGLEPIRMLQEPFLLLCNPPYIPAGTRLMKDVEAYEPHMALFGGADGAELIRTVIQGAAEHPHCVGLVMECETGQMP
jgi:release factor glutamine methyltransferase